MDLILEKADITEAEADVLVVNLCEKVKKPTGATGAVDDATGQELIKQSREQGFTGEFLETFVLSQPTGLKVKHIVLVGLGEAADFNLVKARQVAAKSIQKAHELKAKTIATIVHGAGAGELPAEEAAAMLAEGLLLGNYRFERYKTDQKTKQQPTIETATIIEQDALRLAAFGRGLARGEAIANAILNARDIVNEPPSKVKPVSLVAVATEIASLSDQISLTVLDEAQLAEENYAALLAVSSGSEEPAYLIDLHYLPAKPKGSISFVGKGVTFDSGGLGLKPWAAMLTMKTDMAGAAAVLGIFQALAELEAIDQPVAYEVHGIIAATENMISGKAMRPDDIIETKSGKTIEIVHTDAEGRLILSDALTYAAGQKPDRLIDFATLTGAAIVALGRSYSVYMGNNQALLDLIDQASDETGELAWPLPLPKEYHKYLESPVADLQNVTTNHSAPGAIFGGQFLQEFVGDITWSHIDIAGPSWQEEADGNPVYPKGATGYGILLGLKLLELLN